MIIISDAHVNEATGSHIQFFEMLSALESSDNDLIFLGDIFDLWLALPGYERDIHRRFLTWCKKQKQRRTIGFIEGNHEYFLADQRKDFFSWCTDGVFWQDKSGNVFCHGDQINSQDCNYLLFRKLAKNNISNLILRFFPLGPRFAEYLKVRLKETNLDFRKNLPQTQIKNFAEQRFRKGGRVIFVGHFHQEYRYHSPQGGDLYTVRGWRSAGMVTLFDKKRKTVRDLNWRELFG